MTEITGLRDKMSMLQQDAEPRTLKEAPQQDRNRNMVQNKNQAIDWEAYSASLEGDTELMDMLAQLFVDHVGDQLARLQVALANRDATALESAAHGLKGSLAQVFAEEARRRAEELECRGHERQIDAVDDMTQDLVQLVREVQGCLEDQLAK